MDMEYGNIKSFNVAGRGMADGMQGFNRTKGSLPGQLHKAYLKYLNFFNLIAYVVYRYAAWTLCLANFFKLDWDDNIFNKMVKMHHMHIH